MDFSNYIKFEGNLIQGSPVRITYSGYLFKNGSESISMVYGFGSHWEHTNEVQMERTENGYTTEVNLLNYALFNFCFKNGNNEWDNNYGGNYVFEVTEKVVESAFILNENVISEILENLFEINISEIEEKNAISAPIVEATVETNVEATVETNVEATIEPVSAEPVSEEFEVTYEKNEAVSIEDSLVTSTEATTLNNDIEQLFNEIYQPEIKEQTTPVETVDQETVQHIEDETPVEVENVQTIEETTTVETENVQTIEESSPVVEEASEKQSLLSDILADKATPQEIVEVKEEKSSFNMNSLIDEILSPIITSSSFETEELGDEYSSLQTAEDEKVDELINNLITEIQQTVEEKTTVNYIENNVEETETSGSVETIEEIGSDFNDDEVSLIETLANEAREEVAAKASNESTALIEVKQPDSFLVSARSLGKFYRFKKRVKLAFYKLFKTLPKLLSADFFEEKQ